MNISSTQGSDAALQALHSAGGVDNKRMQLQMMMLKKSLDNQEQQTAEILQQLQGKGQFVDLRV